MIEEDRPYRGIGDNNPPEPINPVGEMRDHLDEKFASRRDEIITAANRKQVTDRATAGDAGDIIKIAAEVARLVDSDRRERTDPLRKTADSIKGAADAFWEPVVDAIDALRARLKAWTDAEDARIEQQAREQAEAMAKMRQQAAANVPEPETPAPPPPAPLPARRRKIRGDLGATVSTVDRKEYRVIDVRAVPDFILESETVKAAIIQVVRQTAKHFGPIPGIEETTASDNQVR